MSGFFSDGAPGATGAPQGAAGGEGGGTPTPATNPPQEGTSAPPGGGTTLTAEQLKGKPDWLPGNFWSPVEEGKSADWEAISKKLSGSVAEGTKKISEQGEKLAKYTVPDSVAPYFEGVDKEALVKATERAGYDSAALDGMFDRLRSAGVGPGPARAFVQAELKSRHEAAPEPKTGEMLRQAAVAELNAAGRPGSEMAKRVQTWGAGMLREGHLSEGQATALEALTHTKDGLEALHAIMGQTPAGPVGKTGGEQRATVAALDALKAKMRDPKFGVDQLYTDEVEREMRANPSLFASYGMEEQARHA